MFCDKENSHILRELKVCAVVIISLSTNGMLSFSVLNEKNGYFHITIMISAAHMLVGMLPI